MHVSQDRFTLVLKQMLDKHDIRVQDVEALANDLIIACAPFALTHRSISVTSQKLLNKTERVKATGLKDAALFAHILTLQRRKLKHRGITTIKPGTPDWITLKTVAASADQFVQEFGLKQKEGYIAYIEVALTKMKKFGLAKIKSMHAAICNEYEAILKIDYDKTPELTKKAYIVYSGIVSAKTGIHTNGIDKIPEKYAVFVDIKDEAARLGVTLDVYITAQFEAFGFRDGIPDPLQMTGDKAITRVQRYCYENKINPGKVTSKAIDWKKIKQK